MLLEGKEAADARAYLQRRGISAVSIERFAVGYAPMYADFLLRRLSRSLSPDVLVEAGLVTKDPSGQLRDRFRGRITFPIHDLSSNTVGFGARRLAEPRPGGSGPEGAKYLNSPETAVYHKGNLLYNLNRAKADLITEPRAFLVEGYTDVIALDQAGIRTAVATCGTAMGEEHLRLLSKFTERAVLAFDSDEAGARAAERAFGFHERYPIDLSVLILPSGEDPADFVLARGDGAADALRELTDRAIPLVEYMIGRALGGRSLDTVEDRARAVRAGLAMVAGLEDPIRREHYTMLVASRTGERETAVRLELERMLRSGDVAGPDRGGAAGRLGADGAGGARPDATDADAPDAEAEAEAVVSGTARPGHRVTPQQRVEREALKLLAQEPALCPPDALTIQPDRFSTPTYRKVYEFLQQAWEGRPGPNGDAAAAASRLVAAAQDRGGQFGRVVAALVVEPTEAGDDPSRGYAQAVFLRLEELSLSRRIDGVRRDLERMNPQKVRQEYEELFERLIALEGRRRDVRAQADAAVAGGADHGR